MEKVLVTKGIKKSVRLRDVICHEYTTKEETRRKGSLIATVLVKKAQV